MALHALQSVQGNRVAALLTTLTEEYDRISMHGVQRVAFGDIFLEDLRVYREKNLAQLGMEALFPIWKRDTRELARDFLRLRFRAIAVCVDPRVLDVSFAGRVLDESFFADLPPGA